MPQIEVILEKLRQNDSSLIELDFSEEDLEAEQIQVLAEMLTHNTCLRTLNLSTNTLGPQSAHALSKLIECNSSIEQLELSGNFIETDGAVILAQGLQKNKTLRYLGISSNRLGDEGALAIVLALADNTNLAQLDLSQNQIGPKGASAVAGLIKKSATIQVLYLNNNKLLDLGVTYLVEALYENPVLEKLYLSNNQIGSEGALYLASALKNNKGLTVLNLSHNQIGDEGACTLALGICQNTTLIELDVSNNQLSAHGELVLFTKGCVNNSTLKLLCIDDDRYPLSGMECSLTKSMILLGLSTNFTLCEIGRASGYNIQLLLNNKSLQNVIGSFVTRGELPFKEFISSVNMITTRLDTLNTHAEEYIRLLAALTLLSMKKETLALRLLITPFCNKYLDEVADKALVELLLSMAQCKYGTSGATSLFVKTLSTGHVGLEPTLSFYRYYSLPFHCDWQDSIGMTLIAESLRLTILKLIVESNISDKHQFHNDAHLLGTAHAFWSIPEFQSRYFSKYPDSIDQKEEISAPSVHFKSFINGIKKTVYDLINEPAVAKSARLSEPCFVQESDSSCKPTSVKRTSTVRMFPTLFIRDDRLNDDTKVMSL